MIEDKGQAARPHARQLAQQYIQQGDHTGWFEALYTQAEGNTGAIPWADLEPNHLLVEWASTQHVDGAGKQALVIGCGLGDDAEELARLGFRVTAFDISPTAVAWCKQRFPESSVHYQVADLLHLPDEWQQRFDFVLEIYTIQTLQGELRTQAIHNIAYCVAPKGQLLVICRGRDEQEPAGSMPWPLFQQEFDQFMQAGLSIQKFEDFIDREGARRFRVLLVA